MENERLNKKEEFCLIEELKKMPPKLAMDILEEIAEPDKKDSYLLRCSKPAKIKRFLKEMAFEKMCEPPRGKL